MVRRVAFASLFLISSLTLGGCLAAGTSNVVRINANMEYVRSGTISGAIYKWVLPERRMINRIEVSFDPIEPLKGFTVYSQHGTDNWRVVKEVKTPARISPYVIHTSVSTDAIRIVQSSQGYIKEVSLYGPEPKQTKFEDIK